MPSDLTGPDWPYLVACDDTGTLMTVGAMLCVKKITKRSKSSYAGSSPL